MTTTCLTGTSVLQSWWLTKQWIFWITNFNRNKLTHQPKQHNHLYQLRSYLLLSTILVVNLAGPCLADNQLRAPVIIEQPVNVTVRRNDPATLACKTEGYPPPSIEWFKDGVKIRPSTNPMILPAGSLFFFQVDQKNVDKFHKNDKSDKYQNSDTGVYWCEATNRVGKIRSRNATLSLASFLQVVPTRYYYQLLLVQLVSKFTL